MFIIEKLRSWLFRDVDIRDIDEKFFKCLKYGKYGRCFRRLIKVFCRINFVYE